MTPSKFHLALDVREFPATVRFLESLLGVPPLESHSDYAKFELEDPPLVLSLFPTDAPAGAGLNHLGFRVSSAESLAALEARLTAAKIAFDREDNVACCHSRQTKLWIRDPAGHLWELYYLEDALSATCAPETVALTPRGVATSSMQPPPPTADNNGTGPIWSHRLGQPLPERIPAEDHSLQQVVLEGTFNAKLSAERFQALLTEAARTLREGGSLMLRGLTADRALEHPPKLPGPAAGVQHVPQLEELLATMAAGGFSQAEQVPFGEPYHFTHAGAELRETRLRARRGV